MLDNDHVRRREVEVAFFEDQAVALESGVQAGERIVTDGSLYLEDGEEVKVQASPEAAPTLPSPAAQGREKSARTDRSAFFRAVMSRAM